MKTKLIILALMLGIALLAPITGATLTPGQLWYQKTATTSQPDARQMASSTYWNGYFYVVFGLNGTRYYNDTWRTQDFKTWESLPQCPYPARYGAGITNTTSELIFTGGRLDNGTISNETLAFNGSSWYKKTSSSFPRIVGIYGNVVYNLNGTIFSVSGRTSTSTQIATIFSSSNDGSTWVLVNNSPLFSNRYASSGVVYNNQMYLIGGYQSPTIRALNDTYSSTDGKIWNLLNASAEFEGRYAAVAFSTPSGIIYGFGENLSSTAYYNSTYSSTDGKIWTKITSSANPPAREAAAYGANSSYMVIFGGDVSGSIENTTWISQIIPANYNLTTDAYGDSITRATGYGDLPDDGSMAYNLQANINHTPWLFADHNQDGGSRNSTWGMINFPDHYRQNTTYQIIAFGANDWAHMDPLEAANNYKSMMEFARANNTVVVPCIMWGSLANFDNYAPWFSGLKTNLTAMGYLSADMFDYIDQIPYDGIQEPINTAYLGDGSIHPNVAGQSAMGEGLFNRISDMDNQAIIINSSVSGASVTVFPKTYKNFATSEYVVAYGDGNSTIIANGSAATHIYATSGNYTLNVSATDLSGISLAGSSEYANISIIVPTASFTANATSGPAPLAVQFNDTSTNTPTSWNWSLGDGSYSELQNPVHTYTLAGNYSVNLTATNAAGSNTSAVQNINVYPPVVTSFVVNQTSGLAPLAVQLTDTSAGSPTAWQWGYANFATGGVWINGPTIQNPTLVFYAGNWSINLTASNAGGSNTSVQTTFINVTNPPYPLAYFTSNVTTGPSPLNVQFYDASSGGIPTSWSWDFTGGSSVQSNAQNPSVTFTAPGQYSINFTAYNAGGSTSYIAHNYITVVSNYTENNMNSAASNINGAFTLLGIALILLPLLALIMIYYIMQRPGKSKGDIQLYTQMIIGCIVIITIGFIMLGIGIGTLGQMFGAVLPH